MNDLKQFAEVIFYLKYNVNVIYFNVTPFGTLK